MHRDAPGGAIARVVIVVYGELIAAAWDDAPVGERWMGTRRVRTPFIGVLTRIHSGVSVSFRNH